LEGNFFICDSETFAINLLLFALCYIATTREKHEWKVLRPEIYGDLTVICVMEGNSKLKPVEDAKSISINSAFAFSHMLYDAPLLSPSEGFFPSFSR
jgi:hypothetical protein